MSPNGVKLVAMRKQDKTKNQRAHKEINSPTQNENNEIETHATVLN